MFVFASDGSSSSIGLDKLLGAGALIALALPFSTRASAVAHAEEEAADRPLATSGQLVEHAA